MCCEGYICEGVTFAFVVVVTFLRVVWVINVSV